ncbi:MAG: GTPase ObgE [Dehalococcoidia bacterium]|nr:GTPase ObgE [Dehalococcoidia bacterium]
MLDKVSISVKAGDGGNGAVTFRREKFVPYGGPDGGDGGKGGDVIAQADASLTTLAFFHNGKLYQAENAGHGQRQRKHGKNGANLTLFVPVGTMIQTYDEYGELLLIDDLTNDQQCVVMASGGNGGLGNSHFASASNQTPRLAEKGVGGERKSIVMELRLLADVGIIGYPNVGKSSLLGASTAANPKIGNYAFTTIDPMLGVVQSTKERFIICEIPGLIEGAHLGKGLGHDFLRHAIRTRVLIHLLDGSSASPMDDMIATNNELSMFDASLSRKPQIVVINKIDKEEVKARKTELRKLFKAAGIRIHFISAQTGDGINDLMDEAFEFLQQHPLPALPKEAPILNPLAINRGLRVEESEDGIFIVHSPGLERMVAGSDIRDPEVRRQIGGRITSPRLRHVIERAGIKAGDRLRIGDFEWTW